MTDQELISCALGALSNEEADLYLVKRRGVILLALPSRRDFAAKALGLYQPQRWPAKIFARAILCAIKLGMHRWVLEKMTVAASSCAPDPSLAGVVSGSQGVLLGNPDHLVRRAIVSYKGRQDYEVAKIAFGLEGKTLIKKESSTIESLPNEAVGVPRLIDTDFSNNLGMMRMPYLDPCPGGQSGFEDHVALLGNWLSDEPPIPLKDFSEWKGIEQVLSQEPNGEATTERLKGMELVPAIRHGDFAQWNLTSDSNGRLLALDWEWGVARGVSGFDLVHYLIQETRLVKRMDLEDLIPEVESRLGNDPCRKYLNDAGWGGMFRDLLIATTAYYYSQNFDGSEEMLSRLVGGESKE